MLMGFKVGNFRSFQDVQYFSMIAGKTRNNENHIVLKNSHKILRFSGMFGANGSGKSNLILAFSIVQVLLSKGINCLINNQYYRGIDNGKEKNSYFEYELSLNDKLYSYGFEINIYKRIIVSEWLIDMTKNKKKIIFERDLQKQCYQSDILNKKHSNFTNCLEEMKKNQQTLFLGEMTRRLVMSSNNDAYFSDIISVFKLKLLCFLGFKPRLEACVNCGSTDNIHCFSIKDNGVKCINCEMQDKSCIKISQSTEFALKYIVMAPAKKLFSFNLKDESLKELELISKIYLNEKLEKEYKLNDTF